ncbi:PadR family transcriptional regulator, partial [Lactobacillus sp. XV13L]|nr:PadR family transcriptional regulator [Lactobacillus sp. XV13L]
MQGRDVVLGLLNETSRTGYEIKTIIETQLSYFFDASIGMIYPTLRKLEKEGKIKKERVYQADKPNKNVYTITADGKAEFAAYLNSPVAADIYKSDCLMRLYFGDELPKAEVISIIHQEIKQKQNLLDYLQGQYDHWVGSG